MNLRIKADPATCRTAHKGLLYDKYVSVKGGQETAYKEWEAISKLASDLPVYRLAFDRWKKSIEAIPDIVTIEGTVRGRLALGLGISSVQEIGCRFHSTYGVPVIPASSLKGVLRQRVEKENYCHFLFGDTDSRGFATIHDAWWIPETGRSGLASDVITVHHQSYYSEKGAPNDMESPVPVHFLSIIGKFYFAIQAPSEQWKEFLLKLLKDVLTKDGIGAKRSAGYGRFQFP